MDRDGWKHRTAKVDGQGQNRWETALQTWTHRRETQNQGGGRVGRNQAENDRGRQRMTEADRWKATKVDAE